MAILAAKSKKLEDKAPFQESVVSFQINLNQRFGDSVEYVAFHSNLDFIALDPAKPWFDLSDPSNTISKDDAAFVDVIHTNSGFLLNVSLAMLNPYSY